MKKRIRCCVYVPSESVSWMAHEIRSRSYYARPPATSGCSRPICIMRSPPNVPVLIQRFDATRSYVRSHLLHCRLALIEAVGDFSAARRFANCTYLSKDAVAVVRARRRRCPIVVHHSLYLERMSAFCSERERRRPRTHHANSRCFFCL